MRNYCVVLIGVLVAVVACLLGNNAHAARPLVTDDATIVDHCQVESWWQRENGEPAFWLLPACNIAGVEWSLGAAKTGHSEPTQYAFSAKTELKPLEPNHYGLTVEVGHEFFAGSSLAGDTHFNFALTKSWFDAQLLIHVNAGRLLHPQAQDNWTSSMAAQWQLVQSQWVFAELFREAAGRPYYQLGYFIEVQPNRLQLDVSYGNKFHEKGRESFVSAGFVYYFSVR